MHTQHARRLRRRPERGLSLLEIMIVIAILGLVMGLFIMPAVFDKYEKSQKNIAAMAVKKLAHEGYPQWAMSNPNESCPPDLRTIAAGVETNDPWGSPYKIMCGTNLPAGVKPIAVLSLGPDRVENTDDDIRSW